MSLIQESQIETSIYICTFQCMVRQATIMMKFPCTYFVQWTTSGGKSIAITNKYKPVQNHVSFNQTLNLTTEMIYNHANSEYSKKQTLIELFLVSRSRPDQNKLVGRVNIDLSKIINFDMYAQPTQFKLNFCSVQGSLVLQFSVIDQKLTSKKVQDLDRSSFIDYISQLAIKGTKGSAKIKDSIYRGQGTILSGIEEDENRIIGMADFNIASPSEFGDKSQQFPKRTGALSDIHTQRNRRSIGQEKTPPKVQQAGVKRDRFTFGDDPAMLQKSQQYQLIPKEIANTNTKEILKQESNPTLVDQIIENSQQIITQPQNNNFMNSNRRLRIKTPVQSLERQESMKDVINKSLKQKIQSDNQILEDKNIKIKMLEEQLQKAYKENEQNIERKQSELKQILSNYEKTQALVKDYEKELTVSSKRNASLSQQLGKREDEVKTLKDKFSASDKRYQQLLEIYNSLQEKHNEVIINNQSEENQNQHRIDNYHEQINELNKQLYEYELKQSQYEEKYMSLEQMVKQLQEANDKSRGIINELQKTKQQLEHRIKFVQEANQELQSELNKKINLSDISVDDMNKELDEKNHEIKSLKAQIQLLKGKNEELAADKENWQKAYEEQITIVEQLRANHQSFAEEQPKEFSSHLIEQLKLQNQKLREELEVMKQDYAQVFPQFSLKEEEGQAEYQIGTEGIKVTVHNVYSEESQEYQNPEGVRITVHNVESEDSQDQQDQQLKINLQNVSSDIQPEKQAQHMEEKRQTHVEHKEQIYHMKQLGMNFLQGLGQINIAKEEGRSSSLLNQQKEQISKLNQQIQFLKESLQLLEKSSNEDSQRAKLEQQKLFLRINQLQKENSQQQQKNIHEGEKLLDKIRNLQESIGFYRSQIDRMIQNLNNTNEMVNQQRVINNELVSEKKQLESQVMSLKLTIKGFESQYSRPRKEQYNWEERRQDYEMRLANLNNNLQEQINQNNELSETIVKYMEKQAKMKETLTILEEQSKQLFIMFEEKEHNQQNYQKMIDDLQKQIDRMRTNFYQIHSDEPSPNKSILLSPKNQFRNSSIDNDEIISSLQVKIDELEQQVQTLRIKYKNASSEYEAQVDKLTQEMVEVTNNHNKLNSIPTDKNYFAQQLQRKNTQIEIWKSRINQNEQERNRLKQEIQEVKIQMQVIEEQKFNLESTINEKDILLLEKQQQIQELLISLADKQHTEENHSSTQQSSKLQQIYNSFLSFKGQLLNQERNGDWQILTKNIIDRSIGEDQTKIIVMEEKSRLLSKQLQKLKSQLLKATSKNQQQKLTFMGLIKVCESIVAQLIEVAESLNLNQSSFL